MRRPGSWMLAGLLLVAGCSRPEAAVESTTFGSDTVGVVTFDSTLTLFYWGGHRIASPAIITGSGPNMKFNGHGLAPPDTTGTSRRLARAPLARSYFIQHRVAQGMSYLDAFNRFGEEQWRTLVIVSRAALPGGGERTGVDTLLPRGLDLDSTFVDMTRPILVGADTASIFVRGLGPMREQLIPRPPATDQLRPRVTSEMAARADRDRVEMLRRQLNSGRSTVLLADPGGDITFSGEGAIDQAREEIANAIAAASDSVVRATRGRIPREMLIAIRRAADPKAR